MPPCAVTKLPRHTIIAAHAYKANMLKYKIKLIMFHVKHLFCQCDGTHLCLSRRGECTKWNAGRARTDIQSNTKQFTEPIVSWRAFFWIKNLHFLVFAIHWNCMAQSSRFSVQLAPAFYQSSTTPLYAENIHDLQHNESL
jgi:hypothetical protein